jgi:choline kinase
MSIRNTAAARQNFATINDLTAVILCAGKGRRTSSIGSKSMTKVNDTYLINHQIAVIREKFPNIFDIVIVLGFDAERIFRVLPSGVRVVENESFETTNISRSVAIGLKASRSENIFIIYGDILFGRETFDNFTQNSCVAIDTFGRIDESKIGVTIENNRVVNLAYGLENGLWAQLGFFRGREIDLLRKITYNRENDPLCGFEILNKVLHKGGKIEAIPIEQRCALKEFNCIKDMLNKEELI